MINGTNMPEVCTLKIISKVKNELGIQRVFTCGSSKGGSAALYYGLKLHADFIFPAACQYKVGSYLYREEHRKILQAMAGNMDLETAVEKLNNSIEKCLEDYSGEQIELFYSDSELTYERHIIPLKTKMNQQNIPYTEVVEHFKKHEEVGFWYLKYLISKINRLVKNK